MGNRTVSREVDIPDGYLRVQIRSALRKEWRAPITEAEMATLTRLSAEIYSINNLTGLEFATNLTELDLWGNSISDISVLKGLPNLTSLNLEDNSISDLSALSGLTNLTSLHLGKNSISDISVLKGLPNLTSLNLKDNSISDFSALSSLPNLTSLNLEDNSISDLSTLSGLTNLTSLHLGWNSISDISALSDLTNLTSLHLGGNPISDLSVLSHLTNLTSLHLGDNSISDISALSGLKNLTLLNLWRNSISDISALSGLTNLTSLHLGGNPISDLSVLSHLTNLTSLHLGGNSISDLSALSDLTNLTELFLRGDSISDLSALSGLTNLTWLSIGGNSISDLSPLVANIGLGSGDEVKVEGKHLSYPSIHTHIPALQSRGVTVHFRDRKPQTLEKISGDNQNGPPDVALAHPFVVEIQDQDNTALAGVAVRFTVTTGGGTLSVENTETDTNGRAQSTLTLDKNLTCKGPLQVFFFESTLTLGTDIGTNTVEVAVAEIQETQTFTPTVVTPLVNFPAWTHKFFARLEMEVKSPLVNIPDRDLRVAIERRLRKKSDDPITEAEMATLTQLSPGEILTENLTGLNCATNLKWLELYGSVSDISVLSCLTNLRSLEIQSDLVSDISVLSRLTKLKLLRLQSNINSGEVRDEANNRRVDSTRRVNSTRSRSYGVTAGKPFLQVYSL